MGKRHVVCVVGTRPEAIKMAPVVLALRANGHFRVTLVATGQHRDLVAPQLAHFGLIPDIDLGVAADGLSLTTLSARLIEALGNCFSAELPDLVIGQGDTVSAWAAAMASFFAQVPFAHVEAGLRTDRLNSPYPEEANRQMISRVAALHFAPTRSAARRLIAEGVIASTVITTGNSVIDALIHVAAGLAPAPSDRPSILLTLHRREAADHVEEIFAAIALVARTRPDVDIIYPVHPRPGYRERAYERLGGLDNVRLLAPLDYPDLVAAMRSALFVVTDSGGLQEEAPALGKPVLVMRDVSERQEAVESGAARLIGTRGDDIARETLHLLDCAASRARMSIGHSPYGDGQAGRRIAAACGRYLGVEPSLVIDEFDCA